jgi:molybdopterin-guanine dinucleotide biosynthesis protein A
MSTPAHCIGAIIAGGRATRFGGVAKGLEQVGGVRIIDRVAAALRESCDELIIVANDPAAADWIPGVRAVADVRPGFGALGGVHAALVNSTTSDAGATAQTSSAIVLAWDSPFVPGALLRALRDAGEAANADAAVPTSGSPWGFEPLCAWYRASCAATVERHLDSGDLHAGSWLRDVSAIQMNSSPWGDPDEIFFNVNSAEDLAMADSLARRSR